MKSPGTLKRAAGWSLPALIFVVLVCMKGHSSGLIELTSKDAVRLIQKLVQTRPVVAAGKEYVQPSVLQDLQEVVAGLTPKGWEIFDEVKQFTPESLYEQIDGRAEFFLAYDVIRMTFASFINSADTGKFIDLSVYDMGTPTNAFGVFSAERSQGEPPLALGRAGYRSYTNYYIWKGQYYIRIIASHTTGEFLRIGMDLAQKMTDFLQDSGEPVWGLTALPQADLVTGSVQYFKVDAMGLDFMRNTFTAQYQKGAAIVTAFLSRRDSKESAETTVDQYAEYAKQYGKGVAHLTSDDVKLISCDMGGSYDVVFQKGRQVGGVLSVESQSLAVQVATDLWRQLR